MKVVYCKNKHHIALCNQTQAFRDKAQALDYKEPKEASSVLLNPAAAPFVGQNSASDANLRQRVALQTAIARVNGVMGKNVRVLFDSGSQRTFVTVKAARRLGLEPVRKEEMRIKAFGVKEAEVKEREVYRFSLSPVFRSTSNVFIEAVGVVDISSIANQRVERIKKNYVHLQKCIFFRC